MLQRRDLFRAIVAGLVTKVIGPAHATKVTDVLTGEAALAAAKIREIITVLRDYGLLAPFGGD